MSKIQLASLRDQKAFGFISKKAVRYSCRFFTILVSDQIYNEEYLTRKQLSTSREVVFIGFKISRKYGKSTKRQLLRRRIKNILHSYFRENYAKLGIIFIPKKEINNLKFSDIKDEIYKAINWCRNKNHSKNI